jgi:hypothetical protein
MTHADKIEKTGVVAKSVLKTRSSFALTNVIHGAECHQVVGHSVSQILAQGQCLSYSCLLFVDHGL